MLVRRVLSQHNFARRVSQRVVRGSGSLRASAPLPSRRSTAAVVALRPRAGCSHGFHSCASCADAKAPETTATAAATPATAAATPAAAEGAAETPFDFGAMADVKVALGAVPGTEAPAEAPLGLPQDVARQQVEAEQDAALKFGSEPHLPQHLYRHLHSIDLFVKPQAMDAATLAELKAKIIEINRKIRSELSMQPSEFYRQYYKARDTPAKDGQTVHRKAGSYVPHSEFHPLASGGPSSPYDEAPVNDQYLASHGLNNDPNQGVFDLLGHSLPKPLPKRDPCLFCRPPRDHPPAYYRLDYTNVNLLHRFLDERGSITAKKHNNNCSKHQRKVARAIKHARFIGLLSFTNLYHVPREFVNAPDPKPDDTLAGDAEQTLQKAAWQHGITAASLPTGTMAEADLRFWTQEGSVDDIAQARIRRPAVIPGMAKLAPAPTTAAAAAAKKKRDPNAL